MHLHLVEALEGQREDLHGAGAVLVRCASEQRASSVHESDLAEVDARLITHTFLRLHSLLGCLVDRRVLVLLRLVGNFSKALVGTDLVDGLLVRYLHDGGEVRALKLEFALGLRVVHNVPSEDLSVPSCAHEPAVVFEPRNASHLSHVRLEDQVWGVLTGVKVIHLYRMLIHTCEQVSSSGEPNFTALLYRNVLE